jgi:hypothetical protein
MDSLTESFAYVNIDPLPLCAICLEVMSMEPPETVTLNCHNQLPASGHSFHRACMIDHLQSNNPQGRIFTKHYCPLCRAEVSDVSVTFNLPLSADAILQRADAERMDVENRHRQIQDTQPLTPNELSLLIRDNVESYRVNDISNAIIRRRKKSGVLSTNY